MKKTRTYTMTARAEATAETRRRILQACVDVHSERLVSHIGLDDIAQRAGVSVQTVLRHFGSRAGLVEEALAFAQAAVGEERRTPAGDVDAAVHSIVAHYENQGDQVMLMLAQEESEPLMARVAGDGRELHRRWVEEVFAPFLPTSPGERAGAVDLLVVATDVYTWKLLRRDRGLSRADTEDRINTLLQAVLRSAAPTLDRPDRG